MKQFIKNNPVLVLGIALPLVLVILFAIAAKVPQHLVDPPGYDFLFVSNYYTNHTNNAFRFNVVNGKLKAEYRNLEHTNYNTPRLFYFDANKQSVREISSFILPDSTDDKWHDLTVPDLSIKNLTLDNNSVSPDGYMFQYHSHHRRYGLLGLFSYHSNPYSNYALIKNGNVVRVPYPNRNYYYNSPHFLGWVIPEK